MSLSIGVATYFVVWLISLLMVLPFGAKQQVDPVPGTPESAPDKPRMLKRALITTVLAAVIWFIIWIVVTTGVVDLRGEESQTTLRTEPNAQFKWQEILSRPEEKP